MERKANKQTRRGRSENEAEAEDENEDGDDDMPTEYRIVHYAVTVRGGLGGALDPRELIRPGADPPM